MVLPLERVRATLAGKETDHVPICPILHVMAAHLQDQTIGRYATDATFMADCVLRAYRTFGYDGLQLSLGVATEAEAMGSVTMQPEDGLPVIVTPILQRPEDLCKLRKPDVQRDGRLPLFAEAISRLGDAVGNEAWIVATIRGPLLMATQLRGVENMLIDLIDSPLWADELMSLTTQVGIEFGKLLLEAGAHAISIGEATSSPDFISPNTYRRQVRSHHKRLVEGLRKAGCETTIMHICGQTQPIITDVAETGTDVLDIDWQVDVPRALDASPSGLCFRGNIDPVSVLLYGTPDLVEQRVETLLRSIVGRGRFILGSGCDVPPDTPAENIRALVRAGRRH